MIQIDGGGTPQFSIGTPPGTAPSSAGPVVTGNAELDRKLNGLKWFHRFEIEPGVFTPGNADIERLVSRLSLPADLSGKSVLDIGSYDGGLSFTCERRGASRVVAYDTGTPRETAQCLAEHLKSRVEFRYGTVYTLDPKEIGTFDVVIFSGVLYHLRYPALGIDRIRTIARGEVYVETFVLPDNAPTPHAVFFETTELNSDPTNWTGPNVAQVQAWFRSAGFAIQFIGRWEDRATFVARVRPGPPPYLITPGVCDLTTHFEGMNLLPEE